MDLPYSSTFTPFSSQYETPTTVTTATFTQFPPQQEEHLEYLHLLENPPFLENGDLQRLLESHDTSSRPRKTSSLRPEGDQKIDNDSKKKKIVHREVERQRRSEMSSLHASLRSLLPHEYIRGKRAMSDHLGEAVKYILHLEQNIKALKDQRDGLKNELVVDKLSKDNREVKVKSNKGGGVEVNVRTNTSEIEGNDNNVGNSNSKGINVSRVLQCLTQEGFDVISCISHRVDNSTLIHCIQAQAEGGRIIATDAVKLQQKLEDL